MSTRSERDRSKVLQEKHQAILSSLLKDEDNKYCVDCDAKGPRWASWNLGVFMCIRCAGIHRNLGVHISKVKSVNLDSWTPEQMQMVQEMGNSRARAVYEANLPDGYRRPQTDSPLESFIRAKYEQKKWIAKEWVPPKPRAQVVSKPVEDDRKERKKTKPAKSNIQLGNVGRPKPSTAESRPAVSQPSLPPQPVAKSATDDLLGLDAPAVQVANTTANNSSAANDLFGDFLGAPAQTAPSQPSPATQETSLEGNLFGESEQSKSTKDSIMALFGSQPNPQQQQQQQFGVPGGMYMPQQQQQQQQPQQQYGGMMGMHQGMMGHPQQQQQQQQMPGMMPGHMGMQGNMMGMQAQMGGMPVNPMQSQMYNMQQQQMYMQQVYPQSGMVSNGYDYQQQSQQLHYTNELSAQVQQQLAGMTITNPAMGGYPQQGTVAAGGTGGTWNSQPAGHTLSTNLWQ